MIIWISGPTGAGKSSLASALGGLGYSVVEEQLPHERFQAFASDPISHCESVQAAIMRSRFDRWTTLNAKAKVIFDRSIDEDIRIFCNLHRKLGFLSEAQYLALENPGS